MMTTIIFASAMTGAVISLLRAIRVDDGVQEVVSKTAASLIFVTLGFLRWSAGDTVGGWLLAGLALCALGDVLLLGEKTFDPGLGAFLLGHVCYIVSFDTALPFERWPLLILLALAVAGGAATRWLWPHLGRRKHTVASYVIVISVMMWGGFSTSWKDVLPWTAAWGALLFYLSDLTVARQRFVRPGFVNRVIGLPLYYAGQFLIALTIG